MLMKWCLWREVTDKMGMGWVKYLISTLGGAQLIEVYFERNSQQVREFIFILDSCKIELGHIGRIIHELRKSTNSRCTCVLHET